MHRVLNSWWVGDYPIRLTREGNKWKVKSQPSETEATQWLEECRLADQVFASRKDALHAAEIALAMPGAPEPIDQPKCVRISPGRYRLAGDLVAARKPANNRHLGWDIMQPEEGHQWGRIIGSAQSLWRAAWIAHMRHIERDEERAVGVRGH